MEDVKIILSALWGATVLTYLYGDVLRIFSGARAHRLVCMEVGLDRKVGHPEM